MEKLRTIVLVVGLFLMTFPLIIITILFQLSLDVASAQFSTNGTKTWLDTEHNVKILFTTRPTQPVIGTPTDLEFSVQNL